jgi:hypothetical protein
MKSQWEKAGIAIGALYHPPDVPLPRQRRDDRCVRTTVTRQRPFPGRYRI